MRSSYYTRSSLLWRRLVQKLVWAVGRKLLWPAVEQVAMEEFQVMKAERDQALMELKSVRQIIVSEEEQHRVSLLDHLVCIQWSGTWKHQPRLERKREGEREEGGRERERDGGRNCKRKI